MDSIHAHLTDGTLPADRVEARAVRRRSTRRETTSCARSTKVHVVIIQDPDPWPSRPFGKGIIGQLSTLTPPRLCRSAIGASVSVLYRKSLMNHLIQWLVHGHSPNEDLISSAPCRKARQFDCSRFNISVFFASPAHPQSNGQVEAINKIIKKTLKKKLGAAKGDWPAILPEALWAINTSYRRSTGETPFSLAFGTEAFVPVEVHAPTCRTASYDPKLNEQRLTLNLDLIDEHRSQAQLQNAAYKQRTARYYDSRVKHRSFKVGDWVLRKVSLATRTPTDGTLGPSWEGPYAIVSICQPGTYRLRGSDGQTLGHPWNVEHLRFYYK
ncbi:unnamed protein product [Prunus brigantina]